MEPSQSALQGSDDCGGLSAPSSPAHDGSPPEPSAPSPPTQSCPPVEDPHAAGKIVLDQQGHERTSAPQPLVTATSAAQARRLAARKRKKLDAVAGAPGEQLLENGGETTMAPTAATAVEPPLDDEAEAPVQHGEGSTTTPSPPVPQGPSLPSKKLNSKQRKRLANSKGKNES